MRAIYDYTGSQEDDINFCEGDLIRIMYEGKDGWAEGLLGDKYGYVPIAYFEPAQWHFAWCGFMFVGTCNLVTWLSYMPHFTISIV